ncbi:MAG: dipeptide/oligopeptide/nickel ABC transporter ATP-binding protein [Tissierellia bacterium]|nr:dipeptide/oligopeptide/nickel ABC transporter ATP-binding protein [Tissierellia bacterium]
MNRECVVKLEDLSASYQEKEVLQNIHLRISRGEFVGLVGESGSGKSTLAYIIAGWKKPTKGKVRINDQTIGFVMQNPQTSFDPLKTIFFTLRETRIARLKSVKAPIPKRREMIELFETWFLKMGLAKDRLFDYPHQFSGGELQRISIVRALLRDASFIILDEPTSMLDVLVQAKIIYLLIDLQKELNLTYLFISHDIDLIHKVCDYFYEIQNGNIIKKETKEGFV